MYRQTPKPGERYLHFKGNQYQIICVALHSETREQMVVYQALYGDFACYARPLQMFLSAVDRQKYPQAAQTYRFERISEPLPAPQKAAGPGETQRTNGQDEKPAPAAAESEEAQANPVLLQFLDSDTLDEKYKLLKLLEHTVTDRLIDDFAVALDLVIPEGRLEDRYFQLLNSVRTMQRFENNRFR